MLSYRIISLIFWGIITLVFLYSFIFFPNRHPVCCVYKNKAGVNCPTCGTSRVFSLMLKGCFTEAVQINKDAIGLFFFFFVQWLWRGWVVLFFSKFGFLRTKITLMVDVVLSFVVFLVCVEKFYCS